MRRHTLLSLSLLAAACGSSGDETSDVARAEQASTVVESGTEASFVTTFFVGAGASLAGQSTDEAWVQLTADIEARVSARMSVPACATITTDAATYVDIAFEDCTGPLGLWTLDGTLRAEVTLETEACGAGQCLTAIVYTVDAGDLTVNQTTFSGTWQVRDPLALGAEHTWNGELDIEGPQRSVHATSSASFSVTGVCVTTSLDAEVTGSRGGSITVSADEVTRCLDACPIAGTVTVTGAAGGTLTWTYDGTGSAHVVTGGGASFDVALHCGG
jgi:hypothetical protein